MTKQWMHNGVIELSVVTSMGPRITEFRLVGGASVFADTPNITLPVGDGRVFRVLGGHRLWAAPEVPAITYVPDDSPAAVEDGPGVLRLTQPAPAGTGIEKSLEIRLPDNDHRVLITHHLANRGDSSITVAPWAITMLRTGGTALMPLGGVEQDQFQADRSIVLWPYTRLSDPLVHLSDTHIALTAQRKDPIKLGTSLRRGWLAYLVDELVFVKRMAHVDSGTYADLGASGQVYCSADFCELETLGPLTTLAPSMSVAHREVWELYARDRLPETVDDLAAALDQGRSPELHDPR